MATKRLQGFLRDPLSEYAQHDLWRFTHLTTTGEVVKGSQSIRRIGADGSYDFLLRFGRVLIESKDRLSQRWVLHGEYTINSQTTATTIPALLLATTPVTPEIVQQLEALLADAESARDETVALFDGVDGDFIYHNKNVLSAVSQLGGVPTGGLIESGSNANGGYVKFANGTMICNGYNVASGTGGYPVNVQLPAIFVAQPSTTLTLATLSNASAVRLSPGLTATSFFQVRDIIDSDGNSMTGSNVRFNYISTGLWY